MPCTDEFLIFVPDSRFRSFVTSRPERVTELLVKLGKYARVRRITEGHLCRDVTDSFREADPKPDFADDYAHADHFKRVYGARL